MTERRAQHWDKVYGEKSATDVSWYQPTPETSLRMIEASGMRREEALIDVGGGAATLVDCLLARGFEDISVLDIAATAFDQSQARLGERSRDVHWLVSDVTRFEPDRRYRLWHDRAVLHFLTSADDRERYVDSLNKALEPGGALVLATFGPDGPLKCSGLEVRRYTVGMMADLLGPEYELQYHEFDEHVTPAGATQQFLYALWIRREHE